MSPSTARCLARLRADEWVSGSQLFEVAGTRYGARLYELRQAGHVIEKRPVPHSAVPQYRIVEDVQLTLSIERLAS